MSLYFSQNFVLEFGVSDDDLFFVISLKLNLCTQNQNQQQSCDVITISKSFETFSKFECLGTILTEKCNV